ncbi:hypothetical protein HG535_0E01630 [Zygotorulaspora mrakii]|uniref:ENTH domain-containing protein n=1 Tax=Zygotorulaspora mrakii TaxID=42260 RepID=A0A7H9B530_ZYGMR|nr:uncharacterized protein HG535_0E01630 [Zygotorulaspora mrakii]QLG73079.1 hypothetical protein HG535_0E01630 [Zygotorulaspora mrakii]
MSLEDSFTNMNIYDAKKYFRRAQNVVFNYTEMEAKVREATNNEPWGASSSLMEQISQGTYNLREREEILGMIFRRFTEKGASEWRQIYKALQLLEYLIRHGSERFIDDTRSSINLIKMLESFHYVDSQSRDQGVNVRSRAKALSDLLSDDETIRMERKKARETAKKFKGVAGGLGSVTSSKKGRGSYKSKGISISADTDDEDEEDRNSQIHQSSFKDESPAPAETENIDLFGFNKVEDMERVNAPQESVNDSESDDDDDFADFQSAAPAVQQTSNAGTFSKHHVNNLMMNDSSLSGLTSSSAFNIGPAISEPKKADPFSNLFTSAKSLQEPVKPVSKASTSVQESTPAETHDYDDDNDDDDGFGEMMEAGAPQEHEQQSKNPQSSSNEIDLLSF